MEPDIIRMYSSSPPPLDNGADDDDEDEFGEFGEFTEVESSCVEFADFDAPSYSNSKDGFLPPNLFMPIHDYSDVNSFSCSKTDQDCFAEFSGSTVGQSDLLESMTCNEINQSRTSNSPCDDRTSPSCIGTIQQKEYFDKQERVSPETCSSERKNDSPDLQISNCNGNKVPNLEILTNGFAVLDSVNPQGIENLDVGSHSKGLNPLGTKLSWNSLHSSDEIDTLSNKSTALLDETEHQAHTQLSDEGALKNQDNNVINRVVPQRTEADSTSDENKDQAELESVEVCLSKNNASCHQKENICEQSPSSLECPGTHPISSKSIEHHWGSDDDDGSNEVANEGRVNVYFSRTDCATEIVDCSSGTTNEADSHGQTKPISIVHTEMVSLDGFDNVTNTELVKDFLPLPVSSEGYVEAIVHAVPLTVGDTEEQTGSILLKGTLEEFPQVSKLDGDYDESRNFSADSHSEFSAFDTAPKLTSNISSDVQNTENKCSDFPLDDTGEEDDGEFGDFDSVPKTQEKRDTFQDFDDFADFSSASCNQAAEWNAFEAEQKDSAWAAFDEEPHVDSLDNEVEKRQPHRTEMPITSGSDQASSGTVLSISDKLESAEHGSESAAAIQASLIGRLERIFQVCFPSVVVPTGEETVTTLKVLLEHEEKLTQKESASEESLEDSGKQLDVWMKLQNIHDGYGLRYQWGGSHSNKMLLRSLGIDTRNILFTGNRKQPVIVPMFASGLGMLEPTKEPLKPVSAAEKITSIGHTPPVSPEIAPSDQLQESLPPVQFDWSSSGLTNPLDASGGATLLNLDFFGPVDDSSCSSTTTIPGVDPELYELTTSKLESSNTSSKVTDAFAKLMSTVEKTSTSTRKPKKEEHLTEEAAKVIASLPDLSFMHAKVLMFPTTLTPSTGGQERVE